MNRHSAPPKEPHFHAGDDMMACYGPCFDALRPPCTHGIDTRDIPCADCIHDEQVAEMERTEGWL